MVEQLSLKTFILLFRLLENYCRKNKFSRNTWKNSQKFYLKILPQKKLKREEQLELKLKMEQLYRHLKIKEIYYYFLPVINQILSIKGKTTTNEKIILVLYAILFYNIGKAGINLCDQQHFILLNSEKLYVGIMKL